MKKIINFYKNMFLLLTIITSVTFSINYFVIFLSDIVVALFNILDISIPINFIIFLITLCKVMLVSFVILLISFLIYRLFNKIYKKYN